MAKKPIKCTWKLRRWGGYYGECNGVRAILDPLPASPWGRSTDYICRLRNTATGKEGYERVKAETPAKAKLRCNVYARRMIRGGK